jgi:hypothetical protein
MSSFCIYCNIHIVEGIVSVIYMVSVSSPQKPWSLWNYKQKNPEVTHEIDRKGCGNQG